MFDPNDTTKWTETTLSLARFWIEAGTKNLALFQEQSNKVMDSAISTVGRVNEETQSAYQEWREASDRACRIYTETLENGLEILASALGRSGGPSAAKPRKDTK